MKFRPQTEDTDGLGLQVIILLLNGQYILGDLFSIAEITTQP